MPAFINRKWPSKAGVSLRLHLSQPGKECPITPILTPQGSVWKAGPNPKQKTNYIPMVRKEVDGEGSPEHLFTEPTNWKAERTKGR